MGAMALALFGVADAAFAMQITNNEQVQIDTRNNGRLAWEAFSDVAQRVTMASDRGEILPREMRTELNDKFRAFLKDWKQEREGVRFSEDYCSADLFKRIVTYPVLDATDEGIYEHIFNRLACNEGRTDILRHCLGSQNFRYFVLAHEEHSIAHYLDLLYCNAWEACDVALENGGMATQRDEERAISALFLAETEFSSVLVMENKVYSFLHSQLYYIVTGGLLLPLENMENITAVEKLWQTVDPARILGNLEQLSNLGLTLPDVVVSRLFRSVRTYDVVHRLIADYIENRQTILPESFLNKLEDFERRYRGATIDWRKSYFASQGPCILNNEMGQKFLECRLEKSQEDSWQPSSDSSEDNQENTFDL